MEKKYTVWVGGGEVNDVELTKEEADKLELKYKNDGYTDVVVECLTKTIHEKLKELNIPLGGHYSDLYCPMNKETKKIIDEYEYKCNVTTFRSQIDGELWYDIPFANDDYRKGSVIVKLE